MDRRWYGLHHQNSPDQRQQLENAPAPPRRHGSASHQESQDGDVPPKQPYPSEVVVPNRQGLQSADIALNNVRMALDNSRASPNQPYPGDTIAFSRESLQTAECALNNARVALANPRSPSNQQYPSETIAFNREGLKSIDIALNNVRMALANPRRSSNYNEMEAWDLSPAIASRARVSLSIPGGLLKTCQLSISPPRRLITQDWLQCPLIPHPLIRCPVA